MYVFTANIQREWLARILDGSKKIEYRDATSYWLTRLDRAGPAPFHLRLINGMKPDSPEATVLVTRADIDLLAGVLRLHISEVVSISRWDAKWQADYPPLPNQPSVNVEALLTRNYKKPTLKLKVTSEQLQEIRGESAHQFAVEIDSRLSSRLSAKGPDPFMIKVTDGIDVVDVIAYELYVDPFSGVLEASVVTPPNASA